MNKKVLLLLAMLLANIVSTWGVQVDTIMVKSSSMNKNIQVIVVTPDVATGEKATHCPVIYLLHGYGGNAQSWISIKPNLPEIANEKGIIFVCPDGKNSWYWDSPHNPQYRYETFISSELVSYIDSHYKTIASPKGRAITGLSMGGHGAMWNALRHPNVFGATGSTSGGVDIRPFPMNWEITKQLGEMATNKDIWDEHTIINQLNKIKNKDLAIIIDCGEDDFFLNVNKDLHQHLLALKIDHDFTNRPGGHTTSYWENSIDYHILFFKKFFDM